MYFSFREEAIISGTDFVGPLTDRTGKNRGTRPVHAVGARGSSLGKAWPPLTAYQAGDLNVGTFRCQAKSMKLRLFNRN